MSAAPATKRILLIAFHFPPLAGSSGIQRTLRFAQHLPQFGWEPIVLTAQPRAYERTSDDLLAEVPPGLIIERAFALDTSRHLALLNRYPGFLARPDRWMTWRLGAVPAGLRLIKRYRPDAIWSTYPIATAHEIGAALHARTGLPWIADFRDPMAQDGYPADPKTWQRFEAIERHVLHHATHSVFTTPGAARVYRERYPGGASRVEVIENGYDEESFAGLDQVEQGPLISGKLTLLHSGIIYPSERDPRVFFDALAALLRAGRIDAGTLRVRLRAAVHDEFLGREIAARGLGELVELAPPLPYRKALEEMVRADGLLVMQASNCNEQIPAKIYEYLRARRPILGLTDPKGDTAWALRQSGLTSIAPLDAEQAIAETTLAFIDGLRSGAAQLPDREAVERASRLGRTRDLVSLLAPATENVRRQATR